MKRKLNIKFLHPLHNEELKKGSCEPRSISPGVFQKVSTTGLNIKTGFLNFVLSSKKVPGKLDSCRFQRTFTNKKIPPVMAGFTYIKVQLFCTHLTLRLCYYFFSDIVRGRSIV